MAAASDPSFVDSVRELVTRLSLAKRAYKEHKRDHPELQQRHNEVLEQLEGILEKQPRIRLVVGANVLLYEDNVVIESGDPTEIPQRLAANGIREIHFVRGVMSWELASFLDALNMDFTDSLDDDLSTVLWERDLEHIRHETRHAEQQEWATDCIGTLAGFLTQGRELPGARKFTNIHRLVPLKEPLNIDTSTVTLTEQEHRTLETLDTRDRERDLGVDVLKVLLGTLTEGGASDEQITQILTSAVTEHSSPNVRAEALMAAAERGGDTVQDLVIHGLRDEHPTVRAAACQLAPRFPNTRIVLTLASLMREDDFGGWQPEDKRAVAVAYARAGKDDALHLLEEFLHAANSELDQRALAAALLQVKTAEGENTVLRLGAEHPELAKVFQFVQSETQ